MNKIINAMAYNYCMREVMPKLMQNIKEEINKPTNFSLSWTEYKCLKCGKIFDTERKCMNHINKTHKSKNKRKKMKKEDIDAKEDKE